MATTVFSFYRSNLVVTEGPSLVGALRNWARCQNGHLGLPSPELFAPQHLRLHNPGWTKAEERSGQGRKAGNQGRWVWSERARKGLPFGTGCHCTVRRRLAFAWICVVTALFSAPKGSWQPIIGGKLSTSAVAGQTGSASWAFPCKILRECWWRVKASGRL